MTTGEKTAYTLGLALGCLGFFLAGAYLIKLFLRGDLGNIGLEAGLTLLIGVVPASAGFWVSAEIKRRVFHRELEAAKAKLLILARKNFGVLSLDDIRQDGLRMPMDLPRLIAFMEKDGLVKTLPGEENLYQFTL